MTETAISVDDDARGAGLEVKRDGGPIGASERGIDVPVDPGSHVVEASAPGKQPFAKRIEIAGAVLVLTAPTKTTGMRLAPRVGTADAG